MGKAILITSGKGGTGKTVFTSNMGATLALMGYKVVMIDMDMGLRNLDLCMGLENKVVYDVSDVCSGICRIKQALIKDKRFECLHLLAAPHSSENSEITPLHMQVLCEKLKEKYDYVLIDSPSGIDEGLVLAAAGADKAVIVTSPEYTAVRDADKVDLALVKMEISERMYVLNKVHSDIVESRLVPSIEEISELIKVPLAGIIPYDNNIRIAANNGITIVLKEDTYINKNFKRIVERIIA